MVPDHSPSTDERASLAQPSQFSSPLECTSHLGFSLVYTRQPREPITQPCIGRPGRAAHPSKGGLVFVSQEATRKRSYFLVFNQMRQRKNRTSKGRTEVLNMASAEWKTVRTPLK